MPPKQTPDLPADNCLVFCSCNPAAPHPIQVGRWDYFCTTCKECSYLGTGPGTYVCIRNVDHALVASAMCNNREPKKCGKMTAKGECVVLENVRRIRPDETCPLCTGPDDDTPISFMVQWDCGHAVCVACFAEQEPNTLFCTNQHGHLVPECRLCNTRDFSNATADRRAALGRGGAVDIATFKLLATAGEYGRLKDVGTSILLGREVEGTVCGTCRAVNISPLPRFPCGRCGTELCGRCRAPRATCRCSIAPTVLLARFQEFWAAHMWLNCPRCHFYTIMKDDRCIHVRCGQCSLTFCYACHRARPSEAGFAGPKCRDAHSAVLLDVQIDGDEHQGIIAAEVVAWQASTWEHAFFLMRAYAVVTAFFARLSPEQAGFLRRLPCPVTEWLSTKEELVWSDDRQYVVGQGCDAFLNVSGLGWEAFLGSNRTAERLEVAGRRLFPEWFEDIRA